MKCAVMQPTYLPWAGYFNLIASVDRFYFLDDAQYERGTWQQRNRILRNGEACWLTVPTRREQLGQLIQDVQINPLTPTWRRKHAESIRHAYLKAQYRVQLQPVIDIILDEQYHLLGDLNIALIDRLCEMLKIHTPRSRTSALELDLSRSLKLVEICRVAGCDEYLSPTGASEYLVKDGFVELSDVRLGFQDYTPGTYPQAGGGEFVSHLSMIDVIANIGAEAASAYVSNETTRI